MNWYKHDTDATQDAKVKKLIIRYGPLGYAIYFHCLELIAAEISEQNLTFELEHDSEIIADNLHIKGTSDKSGRELVEEVMRYILELGLFQESDGRIFCFKLLRRIDLSMTSNQKFRDLIQTAKEENHDDIMIPSCKPSSLQTNKPSSKQTKHDYESDFTEFWESYPRKDNKKAASKAFAIVIKTLSLTNILDRLSIYKRKIEVEKIQSQYIRMASTFLNNIDDYAIDLTKQSREPPKKKLVKCPVCDTMSEYGKCHTCEYPICDETLGLEEEIRLYKERYENGRK